MHKIALYTLGLHCEISSYIAPRANNKHEQHLSCAFHAVSNKESADCFFYYQVNEYAFTIKLFLYTRYQIYLVDKCVE